MLEQVSRDNRKDLVAAATKLYKSGAEPNPEIDPEHHYTRAERRQGMRALGFRGTKAKRQNIAKPRTVAQVILADEALAKAKDRAAHPLRSRLRRI